MFTSKLRKNPSRGESSAKLLTIAAIVVSLACLVPLSASFENAYSQSNNDDTTFSEDEFSEYFTVPVPDSDGHGYFQLYPPDDWTKEELELSSVNGVETASATVFCPPVGCGEASLQLFAYLSTPGTFFPTGRVAQPEAIFQGIIDYNEGMGLHATGKSQMEGSSYPGIGVDLEGIDDQGQKITGTSVYYLSEEYGVLWELTYITKGDSWDHYNPIFQEMKAKPIIPNEVHCREDQTAQCFEMESKRIEDTYCAEQAIWGYYCQTYP